MQGVKQMRMWEMKNSLATLTEKTSFLYVDRGRKVSIENAYFLTALIIDSKDIYVPMHLLILTRISPRISKHLNDTRDLKAFYCVKYIDPSSGHSCRSLVFHFSLSSGLYRGCQVKCHQKDNSFCRDIICISTKKKHALSLSVRIIINSK